MGAHNTIRWWAKAPPYAAQIREFIRGQDLQLQVARSALRSEMASTGQMLMQLHLVEGTHYCLQHMVVSLLKLQGMPQADAADALAVALCHNHTSQTLGQIAVAQTSRRGRYR